MSTQTQVTEPSNAQIQANEYILKPKPIELDQLRVTTLIEMEIRAERQRQDAKFGPQSHEPFKWLAILGEEVGEVNKAALDAFDFKTSTWSKFGLEDYRTELIQVAAVAKAMVENLDRGGWPGVP